MDTLHKKIRTMREAIDDIKLDIKSMRSYREQYSTKNHSSVSSILINNKSNQKHTISPYDQFFVKSSNFNQFKTHCPINKKHLMTTKINKPCLISHNKRQYNFNYQLDSLSQINQKIKEEINQDKVKSIEDDLNESKNHARKQRNINKALSDNLKCAHTDYKLNSARLPMSKDLNNILQYNDISSKKNKPTLTINNHKNIYRSQSNVKLNIGEYEKMVKEIIQISNQYSTKQLKISTSNLIENYRKEMREIKLKNELINKMYRLHNAKTGVNIENEEHSILKLWRWIKTVANSNHSIETKIEESENVRNNNDDNNNCYNEYKQTKDHKHEYTALCERIMEEYNMKDINELTLFINLLLQRVDNNDCFLEGIKKILLHEYKMDNYCK